MFERRHDPLLSRFEFYRRLGRNALVALVMIGGSLMLGMWGYHAVVGLPWVDALLNASMILTGMGPVDPMRTDASKLFASAYALFSGVVFLSAMGVFWAPMIHRFLHHFHL